MSVFRLILAYDGSEFFGSQVQPGQRTVQGTLVEVLRGLGEAQPQVTFAGRTDRGVHAVGQVATAKLGERRWSEADLDDALSARLPVDIAVREIQRCAESFHPRFDATWREYRYWIAPESRDPRLARYAWMLRAPVRHDAMAEAVSSLVGRHDFASFASGGEGVPWSERALRPQGTSRDVMRCEIRQHDLCLGVAPVTELRIVADGFLPKMVRNIVGAAVEIGQGRRDPGWIAELLAARDRRLGPPVAPAHGLTLWAVGYDGDPIENW